MAEFKGYEITPYQEDNGMWYAKVQKVDKSALTAGTGRGNTVLTTEPSDTAAHAVEIAKSQIEIGFIAG